jgi:hypothetical protein
LAFGFDGFRLGSDWLGMFGLRMFRHDDQKPRGVVPAVFCRIVQFLDRIVQIDQRGSAEACFPRSSVCGYEKRSWEAGGTPGRRLQDRLKPARETRPTAAWPAKRDSAMPWRSLPPHRRLERSAGEDHRSAATRRRNSCRSEASRWRA